MHLPARRNSNRRNADSPAAVIPGLPGDHSQSLRRNTQLSSRAGATMIARGHDEARRVAESGKGTFIRRNPVMKRRHRDDRRP